MSAIFRAAGKDLIRRRFIASATAASHHRFLHKNSSVIVNRRSQIGEVDQREKMLLGLGFRSEFRRWKWEGRSGSGSGGRYDHIKAEVNCPRCEKMMTVIFSNRPLSISGGEAGSGIYQALNLCPNCKTAFYFRPFKMVPLQGSFVEIGRVTDVVGGKKAQVFSGSEKKGAGKVRKDGGEVCGKVEVEEEGQGGGGIRRMLPTPKEMCRRLDEFVVGQEQAKKVCMRAYGRLRVWFISIFAFMFG